VYSSLWETHDRADDASPAAWDHTGANVPHLNPNQAGRYSIYILQRDERLSLKIPFYEVAAVACHIIVCRQDCHSALDRTC